METKQALDLIRQVLEQYRGSLQEHTALQQAFKLIQDEVNDDKGKKTTGGSPDSTSKVGK